MFLDRLRILGGQPDEDDDADHRDRELQRARREEDVDQAGDHDADQAHDQERAELREVGLGGVAVEAGGAEHARR